MINYIGGLITFRLALWLSNIDSIGSREAKILTILGWVIALYVAKGDF